MKMRKPILITVLILTALSIILTGCGNGSGNTAASGSGSESTEISSIDPGKYSDTDVSKPEWTLIDIPIYLKDASGNILTDNDGFKYFAFTGSSDSDAQLRFVLKDETADALKQQSPDAKYYIAIGEQQETIGEAAFSEDGSEVVLKGQHSLDELTSIASRIRGL